MRYLCGQGRVVKGEVAAGGEGVGSGEGVEESLWETSRPSRSSSSNDWFPRL